MIGTQKAKKSDAPMRGMGFVGGWYTGTPAKNFLYEMGMFELAAPVRRRSWTTVNNDTSDRTLREIVDAPYNEHSV